MTQTRGTIERPRVERPVAPASKRRPTMTAIALIASLLVGVLAGYLLWGTDNTDQATSDAVATGGIEITTRQEQMMDLLEAYEEAWQNGDGEAVAAMFTENGMVTMLGVELPVENGVLADYVTANPAPTLDVLEPNLVDGNRVFNFHTSGVNETFTNVLEFTTEGDVLIISHDIRN